MYRHYDEDTGDEWDVEDDFEGYILSTHISDKTFDEVGKNDIRAVISALIESGIIDTNAIKDWDSYADYMEKTHVEDGE